MRFDIILPHVEAEYSDEIIDFNSIIVFYHFSMSFMGL